MSSAHVNDVPPTADLSGSATSVNEGAPYTLVVGAVTDPGPDPITGFAINWGDGDTDFYGSLADPVQPNASPANTNFMHTYADGTIVRHIGLSVENDDGVFQDIATLDVTVLNVAPTGNFGQVFNAVNEGATNTVRFTGQVDPSAADAASLHYAYDFDNNGTFDLGGNSYATGVTNSQVTVPSSFLLTPGPHTVKGRIMDKDGGFNDYTTTFTVNNIAPTVNINATANANTGIPYMASGSFTDPGQDGIWSATVDYGDGSGVHPLTVDQSNKTFSLNHTYTTTVGSPFTITVSITDLTDMSHMPTALSLTGTATTMVSVTDTTLQVTSFTQNVSGFDIQFNRAINIGDVKLYGAGTVVTPPISITRATIDPETMQSTVVAGSVIWDASTNTLHWVKTGGVLPTDNYTVTLLSGATRQHDPRHRRWRCARWHPGESRLGKLCPHRYRRQRAHGTGAQHSRFCPWSGTSGHCQSARN